MEESKNLKPKILECSSKGDKRFSAFYAKVKIYGKYDSIENHYQLSKRFGDEIPKTWRDGKGKQPTHFSIMEHDINMEYFSQYYKLLWVKYLDENKDLVEYAKGFDDYNDIFKGKSLNCQADVVRQYIQEGRNSIMTECEGFISILRDIKNSLIK